MQEEIKIVSNIHFILDKLNQENLFNGLQEIFNKILNNEIVFAIKGSFQLELKKIERKTKNFDIKHQITSNTYIFKENLKTISTLIGRASLLFLLKTSDFSE